MCVGLHKRDSPHPAKTAAQALQLWRLHNALQSVLPCKFAEADDLLPRNLVEFVLTNIATYKVCESLRPTRGRVRRI